MKQQSAVRTLALLAILALVMAMSSVAAASPLVDDASPTAVTAATRF